VAVEIFESPDLEASWIELDHFEGDSYRRIWIVASGDADELTVANIYAAQDSRERFTHLERQGSISGR
jgi:hypothetical protein